MRNLIVLTWITMGLSLGAQGKNKQAYGLDHEHVPGQLIVKFKDGIPAEFQDHVIKKIRTSQKHSLANDRSQATVLSFSMIRSEDGLLDIAKTLDALPEVEYVEANYIYRLNDTTPNDPEFSKLYGLNNLDSSGNKTRKDIAATEAWDVTTGSKDVLVGVIDTGIDYTHPDLKDNMWTNPGETGLDAEGNDRATNGIDDDNNGYVDDFQGWDFYNGDNDPLDGHSHGTHCAGTIGAKGNNGIGVVGVNWDVSLVGLKVFSDSGSTNAAILAEAISYSTDLGVDLTSNSWGGGGVSNVIRDSIAEADQAGILFVAAAGNSSSNNDSVPHYPSSYDFGNVVAVASTDRNDRLSSFSSYGLTSVDVGAPGSDIYSTIPGGRYASKSGTSMATPHVAGLLALVKAQYPELNHYQLRDRVFNTANPISSLDGKVAYGRIDASAALELDSIDPSAPANLSFIKAGISRIEVSWKESGDDGDEGTASRYLAKVHSEPLTADNWADGQVVPYEAVETKDGVITAKVQGLSFNQEGYVAIQAFDNVGNSSEISESVFFAVAEIEVIVENDGNLDMFDVGTDTWGLESADGNDFIADSPNSTYQNNINTSLESKSYDVSSDEILVFFDSKYDLETRYDFGFFEVQVDGGAWQILGEFNGVSAWKSSSYDISELLEGASTFKIRFRIETDSSVTKDGWSIDNIRFITPKS